MGYRFDFRISWIKMSTLNPCFCELLVTLRLQSKPLTHENTIYRLRNVATSDNEIVLKLILLVTLRLRRCRKPILSVTLRLRTFLKCCRKPILLVILRLRFLHQTHVFSNFAALSFAKTIENDVLELVKLWVSRHTGLKKSRRVIGQF